MNDFSSPIAYISSNILEFIKNADAVSGMLTAVYPFAQQASLFLIFYTGLRLMLGYGDLRESLTSIFKIIFIMAILFGSAIGFRELVIPGIHGTREFLSSAIGGGSDLYSKLDSLIGLGADLSASAFNSADLLSPKTYPYFLYGMGVFVVTVLLVMIMTFVLLGAEIIILFLISIGPFFVVSFLYSSTRNFFFLWISAVFANIILFVIGAFFIALAASSINQLMTNGGVYEKLKAAEILESGYSVTPEHLDMTQKRNSIIAERDSKLKDINCKINTNYDGEESVECEIEGIAAPGEAEKILKYYNELLKKQESEYQNQAGKIELNNIQERNRLKKLKEEPLAHIVYIGIIILMAILIKVTFEIPSLAQTISGGVGAGASAAALALSAAQFAKGLTVKGLRVGGRGTYAVASALYDRARTKPQSSIEALTQTLTKLNENFEKQQNYLNRDKENEPPQNLGWSGLNNQNQAMTYTLAGSPAYYLQDKTRDNSEKSNANMTASSNAEKSERQSSDRIDTPRTDNAQNSTLASNQSTVSPNSDVSGGAYIHGGSRSSGDVHVDGGRIYGRNNPNAGRDLPSYAGNATTSAIESVHNGNVRNDAEKVRESKSAPTQPQNNPRKDDGSKTT